MVSLPRSTDSQTAVTTPAAVALTPTSYDPADQVTVSTTGSSASAAAARSVFLFLGFLFRRPSKLFRPSRVNTWGALRQLALAANQGLSPSFIRSLMRSKSGAIALFITILPPLLVNTTLGFILFTSHSLFALGLERVPFFQHFRPHDHASSFQTSTKSGLLNPNEGDQDDEDPINLHTLMTGPMIIPLHPTLLSGIAGAGAGIVQGAAFTPVENVARLLQQSAASLTTLLVRFLRLPIKPLPTGPDVPSSPIIALRTFFSSDTWRKSPSWWTGWRWAVARDALSYGVFFAAFDITRRTGLRVKALFGGEVQKISSSMAAIGSPHSQRSSTKETPTIARVAQATTIVTGGVLATVAADFVSRPFRTCQRVMQNAKENAAKDVSAKSHPIVRTFRTQGWRPFLHPDEPPLTATQPFKRPVAAESRMRRVMTRVGWRLAAVGPWGVGFLAWAWVGGEV